MDFGDHVGPEEQGRASVQWARTAVQFSHAVEQEDGLPGRDRPEYGLEILAGVREQLIEPPADRERRIPPLGIGLQLQEDAEVVAVGITVAGVKAAMGPICFSKALTRCASGMSAIAMTKRSNSSVRSTIWRSPAAFAGAVSRSRTPTNADQNLTLKQPYQADVAA